MVKNKNIGCSKPSLPEIIEKKFNYPETFSKLGLSEQREILDYIKHEQLNLRVFEKKWYDVLTKRFYAVEYRLPEISSYGIKKEEIVFDTFQEFYDYVQGDIYENTCLFGASLPVTFVKRHKIDVNRLNFDSFIDNTIDFYTFESINSTYMENTEATAKRVAEALEWIENYPPITRMTELEKASERFDSKFRLPRSREIFASLILRKQKDSLKKAAIKFACKHEIYDGIGFDTILLTYGKEAAMSVIKNFHGPYSYATARKRIRSFKDTLTGFESGTFQLARKPGFDSESQLYFVKDIYFNGKNRRLSHTNFFGTFDEFIAYIQGDLRGAELSRAPISRSNILKFKTDKNTKLPLFSTYKTYEVEKRYFGDGFIVKQRWLDLEGEVICKKENTFTYFFDFVHFLKGDLSGADLLLCEGVENLKSFPGLNLEGIKVRSEVAETLGLPLRSLPKNKFKAGDFERTKKYELKTINTLMVEHPEDDDYSGRVSYITDIHLLHRFKAFKCRTIEDVDYVVRSIAKTIGEQCTGCNLIGGDTSSDFEVFKRFVSELAAYQKTGDLFFTLGNHELWGLSHDNLETIVEKYKGALKENGEGRMHLVQNNLFYADYRWNEITEEELLKISPAELKEKTRGANLILFGGVGFAGTNEEFNADSGIYLGVLDRKKEIAESAKFLSLYEKVIGALEGRNIVVLTHMPLRDWGGKDIQAKEGVLYINGHSHHNYFYDDGIKRIYADNQVGYKGKRLALKQVPINFGFDWFGDYEDGIYEITKEDYEKFYLGIGERVALNREYRSLYLIKREKTYMFLMKTPKENMMILNGGSIRKAGNHPLEYFYDNLAKYAKSVRMFLSKYEAFQKKISSEIKKIGGDGKIHGSIVDIDFYNHLYLNPLDGSITPYFAHSMTSKYVYENIPSLLKYECPKLFENYQKLLFSQGSKNPLIFRNGNLEVSNRRIYVVETDMYRVSRILKGLQFTTQYSIVRLWNDAIVADETEDNGRLIVTGIIDPSTMPKPVIEPKPKAAHKPMVIKPTLSPEEKKKKLLKKYQEKLRLATGGDVLCLTYRGAREKTDYKCSICGHEWSMRPDHFKERFHFKCPNCGSKK